MPNTQFNWCLNAKIVTVLFLNPNCAMQLFRTELFQKMQFSFETLCMPINVGKITAISTVHSYFLMEVLALRQ